MIRELIVRISITILLFLGIVDPKVLASLPWKLIVLILSGLISGVYYGLYNDFIWLSPKINSKENFKSNPDFKELSLYKGHQVWIHLVCGVVGSLALYLLLGKLNFTSFPVNLDGLGIKELVLLLIALLGYTGLLPRTLWFFSNRGGDTQV